MSETNAVPLNCPQCGHAPVTEMIYGLQRGKRTKAFQRELNVGRKAIAGCVMTSEAPAYLCRGCGWRVSLKDATSAFGDLQRAAEAMLEDLGKSDADPRTRTTLDARIAEAKRELGMREKHYPLWIEEGRKDAGKAREHILLMRGIVRDLEYLKALTTSGLFESAKGE